MTAVARSGVPASALHISLADDMSGMEQFAAAWQTLEKMGGCPSPFQSWRWVQAWRKHFRQAEPLLLLAHDEQGAPLALLPLQRERHMGFLRITWMSIRGLQYGGMLLRPGLTKEQRETIYSHLWVALMAQKADYLDLPLLPADDPVVPFLAARCRQGLPNASFRIDFSSHEDWRSYELALKPSARRSRKKRLNKLKRAGELTFTVHPAGRSMKLVLRQALEWKRQWLDMQGLEGALPYEPAFGKLLEALFAKPDEMQAWRVAVLALDGKPIAVDVGKVCNNAFHAWFSAYDAAYSEHSPGKIALWLMMQWCMENGIRAYDMLANPAPYKEDWANERRELLHFLHPMTAAGTAACLWMQYGEPRAREVYRALPPGLKAAVRKPLAYLRDNGK